MTALHGGERNPLCIVYIKAPYSQSGGCELANFPPPRRNRFGGTEALILPDMPLRSGTPPRWASRSETVGIPDGQEGCGHGGSLEGREYGSWSKGSGRLSRLRSRRSERGFFIGGLSFFFSLALRRGRIYWLCIFSRRCLADHLVS